MRRLQTLRFFSVAAPRESVPLGRHRRKLPRGYRYHRTKNFTSEPAVSALLGPFLFRDNQTSDIKAFQLVYKGRAGRARQTTLSSFTKLFLSETPPLYSRNRDNITRPLAALLYLLDELFGAQTSSIHSNTLDSRRFSQTPRSELTSRS